MRETQLSTRKGGDGAEFPNRDLDLLLLWVSSRGSRSASDRKEDCSSMKMKTESALMEILNKITLGVFVVALLVLFGFCTSSLMAQTSIPADPQYHELQTELAGYVEEFAHSLKMPRSRFQWAVFVLPNLELLGPAVVGHWTISPPSPGSKTMWMGVFTFRDSIMLQISPTFRRVIVAHEIGHLTTSCLNFWVPLGSSRELAISLKTLEESCADIISAQLVSSRTTLEVLEWLLGVHPESEIMPARVEMMRKLVEEEEEEEENDWNR